MKKLILSLTLGLALLFSLVGSALAVPPSPAASPSAQKNDYILPYPGILPDHFLYPVKMLRDRIMDFFIQEPLKKTEFLILMADKRLGAGKTLIDYGKVSLGESTISKGENYFARALESFSQAVKQGKNPNDVGDKLEKALAKHIEVLQEVQQKVPEEAKSGIANALENAQKNYQRVLEMKGTR